MSYHKFTVTIDLPIRVHFDFNPYEPMTRHYPGCDASVEITDLEICGCIAPPDMFRAIMAKFKDELEEACWEHIKELRGESQYG